MFLRRPINGLEKCLLLSFVQYMEKPPACTFYCSDIIMALMYGVQGVYIAYGVIETEQHGIFMSTVKFLWILRNDWQLIMTLQQSYPQTSWWHCLLHRYWPEIKAVANCSDTKIIWLLFLLLWLFLHFGGKYATTHTCIHHQTAWYTVCANTAPAEGSHALTVPSPFISRGISGGEHHMI